MVTGGQGGGGFSPTVTSTQDNLPTPASCLPPYDATPSCSRSLGGEKVCELGFSDCLRLFFSATSLSRDVNMNMPEGHPARPHPVRK